jgi:hypothetical protein
MGNIIYASPIFRHNQYLYLLANLISPTTGATFSLALDLKVQSANHHGATKLQCLTLFFEEKKITT